MKTADIIALAKAGFSYDQIRQLAAADQGQKPAVEQGQKPAADQGQKPAAEHGQTPDAAQDNGKDQIISLIKDLKQQMQLNAIMGSAMNTESETAEDVLAQIINPTFRKE